jgi:hypothetical protein
VSDTVSTQECHERVPKPNTLSCTVTHRMTVLIAATHIVAKFVCLVCDLLDSTAKRLGAATLKANTNLHRIVEEATDQRTAAHCVAHLTLGRFACVRLHARRMPVHLAYNIQHDSRRTVTTTWSLHLRLSPTRTAPWGCGRFHTSALTGAV